MTDKVTGFKTNGEITRETMASGRKNGRVRNDRPRVSSPAGRAIRAARRLATYKPQVQDRFAGGYKAPGSLNVRKVGR